MWLAVTIPAEEGKPAGQSHGLLNDWIQQQSAPFDAWDIGGQLRVRYENKDYFAVPGTPGAADFRANTPDPHNSYLLLREKVHVGYTPASWISLFVEGLDASSTGDDAHANESDTFDLHQAFLSLRNTGLFPLTLKIGRQELAYGDERLVGISDWRNFYPRAWDAAKARFEHGDFWMEAFGGRPVLINEDRFNVSNDYEFLSGIYASARKLVPKTQTDFYFFSRNVERQSPTATTGFPQAGGASPRDIYTIGYLLKSIPGEFGGWDFELENAVQLGRFKSAPNGRNLDHEAYALHAGGSYTWRENVMKPMVGLKYNFASGDHDPADNRHTTFDNLYPSNHKFYGQMDFVSWQNMNVVHGIASLIPLPKFTMQADVNFFVLADTHDYFYDVKGNPRASGGYGIKPGTDNFVGSEIDLQGFYAIKPYAVLQAGYGHFFVADYIRQSLKPTGGAHDASWLHAQLTFKF